MKHLLLPGVALLLSGCIVSYDDPRAEQALLAITVDPPVR